MKTKCITKQVPVMEVSVDKELYPRTDVYWQTIHTYKEAMRMGSRFPPIVLAKSYGKLILVDGRHRLEATRQSKLPKIEAEIHVGLNKKQIFEKAIELNVNHGQKLSPFEKRRIALKLRQWKYPNAKISTLIQVPVDNLKNFIGQRLVNSITGETIVKSAIKHMANKEIDESDMKDLIIEQKSLRSVSQEKLLIELIHLFEEDLIDKKNPKIINLLTKLEKFII